MKNTRVFLYLFISARLFVSCGQASPSATYATVSEGELKPGAAVPAPTGDVILTIKGDISQKNSGEALQFDLATLESIGLVEYDVDDPFVKKNIVYTGILFSQLLQVAGVSSDATMLTLSALDDYSVDMEISAINKWPIMVAVKADGEYMPIAQNGPLISIIPFNDFPELDHLTYDAVWVWSLSEITVK